MSKEYMKKGNTEIELIKNLIEKGDHIIKGKYNEIVLLIGNTGSGKSTLAQIMCNPISELSSVATCSDFPDYIIINDTNQTISKNSTINSQTLFPDFLVHREKGVVFCDCPGFNDTKGGKHDIAANYFIKKVTDLAKKIKLVFVVNYSAVRKGNDRHGFMTLMKHANKFIKNMDKCIDSIALIVNKVDNNFINNGSALALPDKSVISSIASFLEEVKSSIEENITLRDDPDQQTLYRNVLKQINVLLEYDGSNFKRIGIFRRPDQPGKLSEIQILKSCRELVENVILNNISYSLISELDISYSVSPETCNYINKLRCQIYMCLKGELEDISRKIINDLQRIEGKYAYKIYFLHGVFSSLHLDFEHFDIQKSFSDINEFFTGFTNKIESLTNVSLKYNIEFIGKYKEFLSFLEEVNNQETDYLFEEFKGLHSLTQYANDAKNRYFFLTKLYEWLSSYDVQEVIKSMDLDIMIIEGEDHFKVVQLLKTLLKDITKLPDNIYFIEQQLANIDFNKENILSLKAVFDVTLGQHVSEEKTHKKVIIKGNYIKTSYINEILSKNEITFIEVYAINRLFIDEDIIQTGNKLQLSFISPILNIIKEEKMIKLDGMAGKDWKSRAADGKSFGGKGMDGKAGRNGGPAGSCLGIAGKVVGGRLHISANGGRGGPGQAGGNGAPGRKGTDGCKDVAGRNRSWLDLFEAFYNRRFITRTKYKYENKGTAATDGGDGGNGGIGGTGGPPGRIHFVDLTEEKAIPPKLPSFQLTTGPICSMKLTDRVIVSLVPGEAGIGGAGGKGGCGYEHGQTYQGEIEVITILGFFDFPGENIIETVASGNSNDGADGRDGANSEGAAPPEKQQDLIDYITIKNNFLAFINEKEERLIDEPILTKVIEELDALLPDTRALRRMHQ